MEAAAKATRSHIPKDSNAYSRLLKNLRLYFTLNYVQSVEYGPPEYRIQSISVEL
jgi:hypothetical protein